MSTDSHQTVTEQLTERARVLKKALDNGSVAAAARIQRAVPLHKDRSLQDIVKPGVNLSEAQFVIAREAGYTSWVEMIQSSEPAGMDSDGLVRTLAHACLTGDEFTISQVLSIQPTLTNESLVSALCLASPEVRSLVDDQKINEPLGPLAWPPLMYLCTSRFGIDDDNIRAQRTELAEFLIDLGADVNTGVKEMNSVRGYRTALGAAIGYAGNADLVRVLMENGADINDGPTLYEGCVMWEAVQHQDMASLELLLNGDPPHWHKCHALPQAMQYYNQDMVNLLLQHGADPNALCYTYRGGPGGNTIGLMTSSGHPREAGLTMAMTMAMIAAGAEADAQYRLLVQAYDAVRDHRPLVIDVDGKLSGEALLEASMMGEEQLVMAFLDAGVDVNFKSATNTTALHQAAVGGYRSLVELLLARGADLAIRDSTYDGTAVGWAYAGGHESLAEMLVEVIKTRDTGAAE